MTDELQIPRRPDGRIDTIAAVEEGLVTGFSAAEGAREPATLVGHWDNGEIVVEYILEGDQYDDRRDASGYWRDELWSHTVTGRSDAERAALMLDAYPCAGIRMAVDPDDFTPEGDDEDDIDDGLHYDDYGYTYEDPYEETIRSIERAEAEYDAEHADDEEPLWLRLPDAVRLP
ncbi:hypothetical protein [Aeromicrobium sp. 179-A 4D2 NHS]|uniref:hypothetical protein n=1 Tax=Aeromicrobium sp. 179-A 4D2 NHS TaxID=3142375 RepID=UPI0039A06E36